VILRGLRPTLALLCALLAPQVQAQGQASVVRLPSLSLEAAVKAASAALADCRERGALVAVAATDRSGNVLAVLRDPLAGVHTSDTAVRKAWTSVSFRNATTALEKATAANTASSGIRHLPGVAMIGGGLPLEAAGSLVGGLGVSGAPSGEMDEACANAGFEAIRDDLEMGS